MKAWAWRVGALTAALAAVSCQNATGPTGPSLTLAAVSVEGNALPSAVESWPDHHLELLADTVRIFRGDRWERVRVERLTGIDGVPRIRRDARSGTAHLQDGGIVLVPTCPPDADCLPGEELEPVPGGYELEWRVSGETGVTIRYREAVVS